MDIYEGENWVGYVNQYSGKIITYTVSEKVLDDIRGYLVFNDNWHFYKKVSRYSNNKLQEKN